MSKILKNRKNKKRNMSKGLQPALDNVVLYSAHCFEEMQIIGVTHPVIKKAIFNQNHKWQIALLVFCDDGVSKPWVDFFMPEIPICKAKELQEICDPITTKMIDKVNTKHFVGSGWYCVLTDKIDLFAMKDDIIELFRSSGALDRQICNLAWGLRPESEK
jgi:hypothetical protein